MSDINTTLIELNKTKNLIKPIESVFEFHNNVKRLAERKIFKESKPHLNSIYRHLEEMPETLLDRRDIHSFCEMIIKSEVYLPTIFDKTVISVNDYHHLTEEQVKSVRSNKQLIITESDMGRDFYIQMLEVERTYDMIKRCMSSAPILEMYNLTRLFQSLCSARYVFLTKKCELFNYVRNLMLFIDMLTDDKSFKAFIEPFRCGKRYDGDVDETESLNELNGLCIQLRVANRNTRTHCFLSKDELQKLNVHECVIDLIEQIKSEPN